MTSDYQKSQKSTNIIDTTVVNITDSVVILDCNKKAEATVPIHHFRNDNLKVGDVIKMCVYSYDDGRGNILLSREKAISHESLEHIINKYENNEAVFGKITKLVNGGYIVDIKGINGFLPGSLIGYDKFNVHNQEDLTGTTSYFKVIKVNKKTKNIIVSRKGYLEENQQEKHLNLLKNLKEGDIVDTVIKNICTFGVFASIISTPDDEDTRVDGLIHIADITWSRTNNPASSMLQIGDKVKAKIIKIENNRIFLSLKLLQENPWNKLDFKVGDIINQVPITAVCDYGCFIALQPGIEGLVHSSEITWKNNNVNPKNMYKSGDLVDVKIIEIINDKNRIALSIRECTPNPWELLTAQYSEENSITKGIFVKKTNFGIFVSIDHDLVGLIHFSTIDPIYEDVIKNLKKGSELTVVIKSIDIEKKRIMLQLYDADLEDKKHQVAKYHIGDKVQGIVEDINDKGDLIILIHPNIRGYITNNKSKSLIKVGEKITANILSITNYDLNLTMFDNKKSKTVKPSINKFTMGDLIREKIEEQDNEELLDKETDSKSNS